MHTVIVWVLLYYSGIGYSGGPAIVDNIASYSECIKLGQEISNVNNFTFAYNKYSCVKVEKVKM